jgi:ATP adenylyltransferase
VGADQVYNCLWSHAGGSPVHINYVVQPVTKDRMAEFGCYGPNIQTATFTTGQLPAPDLVEAISERARTEFVGRR